MVRNPIFDRKSAMAIEIDIGNVFNMYDESVDGVKMMCVDPCYGMTCLGHYEKGGERIKFFYNPNKKRKTLRQRDSYIILDCDSNTFPIDGEYSIFIRIFYTEGTISITELCKVDVR